MSRNNQVCTDSDTGSSLCRHHADWPIVHVALELTQACNYKCVMCDYWRISNPTFMPLSKAKEFFAIFPPSRLRSVLITGGEPLLHPEWRDIAALIPKSARRNLCTNGSPLLKKNSDVATMFDRITVSVDGATDATFKSIRGYAHLTKIMESLERLKAARPEIVIFLKMTIQRKNFREIVDVFELGLRSGFVDGVGFGIPDLSAFAFGFDHTEHAMDAYIEATIPTADELDEFADLVLQLRRRHSDSISSGFLYEGDLSRYLDRFKAIRGLSAPPAPRNCCIPSHSMVLKADGTISGCYFLPSASTLEDLRTIGEQSYVRAISSHRPLGHPICSRCDQLLFRNTPFEHELNGLNHA